MPDGSLFDLLPGVRLRVLDLCVHPSRELFAECCLGVPIVLSVCLLRALRLVLPLRLARSVVAPPVRLIAMPIVALVGQSAVLRA